MQTEINYDYIISYLCNKTQKINPEFLNDFDINDVKLDSLSYYYFNNSCSFDSILNSLIYILNTDDFYFDELKLKDSRNKMINELSLDNDNLLNELCKKLNINILTFDDKINLYSGDSIIDLYNPFVLLRKINNIYYPISENKKKVFFCQDIIIEKILDSEINITFEEYQFLDNLEEIIDGLLTKNNIQDDINDDTNDINDINDINNNIFLKENTIEQINILNKLTKNELVEKILIKNNNYTKVKLIRIKKNELINLLLNIN